ncbi:hypothetical protein Fmac_008053 [Flemingia macrophylla]|uniref:AP2/ERF domain-containing protein n=1 Tax=Flemingia macrophylla TaxID=520843 RepID=A0ABD1MXH9_9FABA
MSAMVTHKVAWSLSKHSTLSSTTSRSFPLRAHCLAQVKLRHGHLQRTPPGDDHKQQNLEAVDVARLLWCSHSSTVSFGQAPLRPKPSPTRSGYAGDIRDPLNNRRAWLATIDTDEEASVAYDVAPPTTP